jgi:hypothetical protein
MMLVEQEKSADKDKKEHGQIENRDLSDSEICPVLPSPAKRRVYLGRREKWYHGPWGERKKT